MGSRIHAVNGDISKPGLGLSRKDAITLQNSVDTVYHSAALCNLSCDLSEARRVNVNGTENILKLALDWHKNGRLKNVNHISTAYIAGNHIGTFYEKDIDMAQGFNNNYEKSKFEAELVVEEYRNKGLSADIYRPGIITDTIPPSTYATPVFLKMLYFFARGFFKNIPADINTKINMVPVDTVSEAIYLISNTRTKLLNQNYQIVNPRPVKFGELLNAISDFFGSKTPQCVSYGKFKALTTSPIRKKMIRPFIPYLSQKLLFDARNAENILKKYGFIIPPIDEQMLLRYLKHWAISHKIYASKERSS